MMRPEITFFNMEEYISLTAQTLKLAQTRFKYRPESFNAFI